MFSNIIAGKSRIFGSKVISVVGAFANLEDGKQVNLIYMDEDYFEQEQVKIKPKKNIKKTIHMINEFVGTEVALFNKEHGYDINIKDSINATVKHTYMLNEIEVSKLYNFNPSDFFITEEENK